MCRAFATRALPGWPLAKCLCRPGDQPGRARRCNAADSRRSHPAATARVLRSPGYARIPGCLRESHRTPATRKDSADRSRIVLEPPAPADDLAATGGPHRFRCNLSSPVADTHRRLDAQMNRYVQQPAMGAHSGNRLPPASATTKWTRIRGM
jgi:hypothetical protein